MPGQTLRADESLSRTVHMRRGGSSQHDHSGEVGEARYRLARIDPRRVLISSAGT